MIPNPATSAVLSLDIQLGVLNFAPGAKSALPNAAQVAEACRKRGFLLIHVGIGFEPGYPELSPRNQRFAMIKERGIFTKGSESAQFHPSLVRLGELVVYKHRVSAFSGNALHMILAARGIDSLVLFGIATSGIVLSTLRQASDLDYTCTVIADACFDNDAEVHRVLTEKVFPSQAVVRTTRDFVADCTNA
jgi:nicotinamidase-related amidase